MWRHPDQVLQLVRGGHGRGKGDQPIRDGCGRMRMPSEVGHGGAGQSTGALAGPEEASCHSWGGARPCVPGTAGPEQGFPSGHEGWAPCDRTATASCHTHTLRASGQGFPWVSVPCVGDGTAWRLRELLHRTRLLSWGAPPRASTMIASPGSPGSPGASGPSEVLCARLWWMPTPIIRLQRFGACSPLLLAGEGPVP